MNQKLKNILIRNKKLLIKMAVLILVVGIFLGGSIKSLIHNKHEKYKLLRQKASLEAEYEQLLQTKELLEKEDLELLEKIARTQYQLAKPDEIEFRFKDK